jgi:hypothetical protein
MFNVHRGVLCKSSKFFKRAMQPEWAERRTDANTLDLSDDPVEIVTLYVQWLYYGQVPVTIFKGDDYDSAKRSCEAGKIFATLAKAYIFGEKVMDATFRNAILLKFIETERVFRWYPEVDVAAIVYEGTTAGAPLRRLISDWIAYNANGHAGWLGYFDKCSREMLADAIKNMATVRSFSSTNLAIHPANDTYLEKEEA